MRLFIAVNLPDAVRRGAWQASGALRNRGFPVKWVEPDGLHLTVKFLGEVDATREPAIVEGIGRAVVGAKPFTLGVEGFGAFPDPGSPRVVWVGCEAAPPLEILQHRVEQEMEGLGFQIEGRPFHPHLTLGRVKREARRRDLEGFAAALEALSYAGEAVVESLDLMESTLTPQGARYARRHAVPLRG